MAASGSANGFNMGDLSSALNDVSASIQAARDRASAAELDAMLGMFESVKVSAKKIAQKKRRPSKARKTPAEEAHELKMRDLQIQLKTETDAANRAIRELTRLSRRGPSNAANARAIDEARAAVAASQQRLAHITSQINNPHTGMNANVDNNGRASMRHSMKRVSMRRGRSMSPRSMSPSSMGRNRNRNGNQSMSRSRSPKGKSMGRSRSRSPRHGGAARKRSNTRKRRNNK